MASYDPAYANSSGYFRDPITGEDLSIDTPRVVQCELKDGKFVWPMVLRSDGEQMLKIVYKYFTDEEKELYKQYRGRGTSEPRPKKEKPVKEQVTLRSEPVQEQGQETEPEKVVKYDPESATSLESMTLIKSCNQCYGVSWICGVTYGLIGKRGEGKVYHVPRSCIPDSEWYRICTGE